jgi:hypothetical protein
MAPRIRILTTGGEQPSTLNGETLYAGKRACIGSGKHAEDKGFLYQARQLQKEYYGRFGGDIKKMEAVYGFNPIFVQVLAYMILSHLTPPLPAPPLPPPPFENACNGNGPLAHLEHGRKYPVKQRDYLEYGKEQV